ncbi:XTP/dITP diphosphatase [Glaciecola sp. 1036]|uniref:XTP/dITP diphosphatase n=1 Tax=Alteromonadaceae TaxID=72275 RepID=UPI003D06F5D3
MQQIVLASGNKGKLAEFSSMFEPYNISVLPQSEFSISDADETGLSFVENAIIKARHASEQANLPAIADDSGLVVDALNGGPGIYSARYAGEHGNDQANYEKLLANLTDNQNRKAKFLCVLVFMRHAEDPEPIICQGEWHGEITQTPFGNGGFGYDPVFYVPEQKCTAAELDKAVKNQISHRGQALRALMQKLHGII